MTDPNEKPRSHLIGSNRQSNEREKRDDNDKDDDDDELMMSSEYLLNQLRPASSKSIQF